MTELLSALFGAIIGGVITFWGESVYRKREDKAKQQHSASILYNDLKSIQTYLNNDFSDVNVNIRYTDEWQRYVANCAFLENHDVALLYDIYGAVYGYSTVFNEFTLLGAETQPDEQIFKQLSSKINHQNFKELMDLLSKKTKN